MDCNQSNKYIITGASGAGKTTLLSQLRKTGFRCVEEVSRKIIREQLIQKGTGLPWKNMELFCALTFEKTVKEHQLPDYRNNVCFVDRALPDIIANLQYKHIPVPKEYYRAIDAISYNKNVVILPPEGSIYINDNERRETFEEAKEIYFHLVNVYGSLGFQLHEIAIHPVEKRSEMVLEILKIHKSVI